MLFLTRNYKHYPISVICSLFFCFIYSLLLKLVACYTIKENNNKEKSFCRGKLPFCRFAGVNYHSAVENWEKPILPRPFFFLLAQITSLPALIEENLFCIGMFLSSLKIRIARVQGLLLISNKKWPLSPKITSMAFKYKLA